MLSGYIIPGYCCLGIAIPFGCIIPGYYLGRDISFGSCMTGCCLAGSIPFGCINLCCCIGMDMSLGGSMPEMSFGNIITGYYCLRGVMSG